MGYISYYLSQNERLKSPPIWMVVDNTHSFEYFNYFFFLSFYFCLEDIMENPQTLISI